MMHRTRYSVVAGLGALALMITGCGGAANNQASGSASGNGGPPATAPGFDGKAISIGDVGLLSGPTAKVGVDLDAGFHAWFKALNDNGGVAGKYPVNIVQGDNQLTDSIAVQQYNQLKSSVAMFGEFFGTPTSDAILPLAKQDQILVGATGLEAAWVQQPNFLPTGPTYQLMAANAMDYYVKQGGGQGKTVCTLTRNDAYGQDAVEGVAFAAANLHFSVKSAPTFVLNAPDFTGQIATLQSANCDTVYVAASPPEFAKILGGAAKVNFTPQWIAQAAGYDPSLLASPVGNYMTAHVWVTGPPFALGDTKATGLQEMIDAQKKYAPASQPSFWFMFGYSQGLTATKVLEQAVKDGNLSRAGILKASQELDKVTTPAGTYQYGPPSRRLPVLNSAVFKLDPSAVYGQVPLVEDYKASFASNYKYPAG
jgi:ABC-type branched-subunit amino acid transport system substrate-binding protein